MTGQKKIRILVDDLDEIEMKSALPGLAGAYRRAVDVELDKLKNNVNSTLDGIFSLLSNVTLETKDFEVDTIRFALHINASGEISLISLAKGSLGVQEGIEFSIVRRHRKFNTLKTIED